MATILLPILKRMNCNTRKPRLLHTKVLPREKIKEELVSSCSEEVALHSEVEMNTKMNSKEQYGPSYQVGSYPSTLAFAPPPSLLVMTGHNVIHMSTPLAFSL